MNTDIQQPTKVRYLILSLVCFLSMITYLDRAAFPNAQVQIQQSFGFTDISQMAWAMAAFNLAYALFEIPTGYLGDVFGPKTTLIRIVIWWSAFTAISGLAGLAFGTWFTFGFGMLIVVRFLFGIGEAGAYPNITRALHNWLPITERGFAQGLVWTSARIMGGLTPLLWLIFVIKLEISWRIVFFFFGAVGLLWCFAFARIFKNNPNEHPAVNDAEKELILKDKVGETEQAHAHIPWGKLFASRNMVFICAMYFCLNFGWYFNLNYLPAIMSEQFQVKSDDWLGALYKGGPLLLGAFGCFIGGFATDWFLRQGKSRTWARRTPAVFGNIACGLCYFSALYFLNQKDAMFFAISIAFAGFCNDLTMGATWATCQDIGQKHAAIVSGTMNMIGNLGGFVVTLLTGKILEWSKTNFCIENAINTSTKLIGNELAAAQLGGYEFNLIMFGLVYMVGAALWFGIDANKPLLQEESKTSGFPNR